MFDIPGLDVEKGLSLCYDDEDLYITFLRSYAKNVPGVLDKVRTVDLDALGDYTINVHGIKSVSASIGAQMVSEAAAKLEKLSKDGDTESVLLENGGFVKDTDNLLASIKAWLEKYDEMQ